MAENTVFVKMSYSLRTYAHFLCVKTILKNIFKQYKATRNVLEQSETLYSEHMPFLLTAKEKHKMEGSTVRWNLDNSIRTNWDRGGLDY